mmetsp:Transcript_11719/g.15210  ORF Transcript_11719/g.15210 Transcript_11719/m.15210 type:complete len:316 (+) Transcript_11719:1252-2199(+)
MKMQNWQHVVDMMKGLNRKPLKMRTDTDFSRVRDYFLDGRGASFRQTILVSRFPDPYLQSIFSRRPSSELNLAGQAIIRPKLYEGELLNVVPSIPQRFLRIELEKGEDEADVRFNYFQEKIFPALTNDDALGTVLVIPSYFDFVRIRNMLHKIAEVVGRVYDSSKRSKNRARGRDGKRISNTRKRLENSLGMDRTALFAALSEYTSPATISRIRGDYFHQRINVLLVTERFHYYYRYRIRGVKRVIFYAPPVHENFYTEFLNYIDSIDNKNGISNTLYTKRDALQLERIVGTKRARQMVDPSTEKSTKMYQFSFE